MKLRPPAEKRKRKHRGPEGSQKSSWRILICRMEKGGKSDVFVTMEKKIGQ